MMNPIDFVLLWVDGNDPLWKARRNLRWNGYFHTDGAELKEEENGDCRYRDMEMLQYWFRAVEKFAPWVNRIFFVTCGQKPAWLNADHPKIVLVNHEDYMPAEYLPTFNSDPIELNLHRIQGLSEHFVLFNDDVFLISPVAPDFFFKDGQPCLPSDLSICDYFGYNSWSFRCLNDYFVLNDHFKLNDALRRDLKKWCVVKVLGARQALKNYLCFKLNRTMMIRGYEHLANPHLKSTFAEVWDTCPDIMDATCRQPFRSNDQVNQWLLCAWNQAKGQFHPVRSYSQGSHFNVSSGQLDLICSLIREQSVSELCLNDSQYNDDPEKCFAAIRQAFDAILPDKSGFEL